MSASRAAMKRDEAEAVMTSITQTGSATVAKTGEAIINKMQHAVGVSPRPLPLEVARDFMNQQTSQVYNQMHTNKLQARAGAQATQAPQAEAPRPASPRPGGRSS